MNLHADAADRDRFAPTVAGSFALTRPDGAAVLLGTEVERGYLWVYQEGPADALRGVWPGQINTVKIRARSRVISLPFQGAPRTLVVNLTEGRRLTCGGPIRAICQVLSRVSFRYVSPDAQAPGLHLARCVAEAVFMSWRSGGKPGPGPCRQGLVHLHRKAARAFFARLRFRERARAQSNSGQPDDQGGPLPQHRR